MVGGSVTTRSAGRIEYRSALPNPEGVEIFGTTLVIPYDTVHHTNTHTTLTSISHRSIARNHRIKDEYQISLEEATTGRKVSNDDNYYLVPLQCNASFKNTI